TQHLTEFGLLWMLWLIAVVVISDVAGYFAGRMIGGPKFWPKISPKKTWSGTVAGWIGAALVGWIWAVWLNAGWETIGISVALAMMAQMGDIAESAVKRKMDVKDSSNLLPGHGGLFDRFDAMLGAALMLMIIESMTVFPAVPGGG
ncbi:phosphatidate cytidylyltransferase, partial [Jannaschia sp.]|nr:phosphatidate cytidylyltransferase [Jannaschia sp.]